MKIKTILLSVFVIIFLTHYSCKTQKKKTIVKKNVDIGVKLSPGTCSFEGEIISIEKIKNTNSNNACSKAACIAKVKITKVLGYGSAFNAPMGSGKVIKMRFKYTLSKTEKLFPNKKNHLPGLKVGSKFKASVKATEEMGEDNPVYTIDDYILL